MPRHCGVALSLGIQCFHTLPSCTTKRTRCITANACGILSNNSMVSGEIIVFTDCSGISSFIRFYLDIPHFCVQKSITLPRPRFPNWLSWNFALTNQNRYLTVMVDVDGMEHVCDTCRLVSCCFGYSALFLCRDLPLSRALQHLFNC
jgi:hypothetical protein